MSEHTSFQISDQAQSKTTILRPHNAIDSLLHQVSDAIWISNDFDFLLSALRKQPRPILERQTHLRKNTVLFLRGELASSKRAPLESLFKMLIVAPEASTLSLDEAVEVFNAQNAANLIVSGTLNFRSQTLALLRGNLEKLVVPLSAFKISGDGVAPRFDQFQITDSGQTLSFGNYEASVESLLYEFDANYRRQINVEKSKTDKRLGACLRRLRLQKGFKQSDFPDVDEREIGRIERGEVKTPRLRTLQKIAAALGINPEDIQTY
ncbi:MAG TPA: helix-turn-helix transcriptional regulator [Pseudobdellovibrionaceae bacterium]|nr:helix-turn-helix transcriptional regulator [Pseudobdellovibrionaceae bacterium]